MVLGVIRDASRFVAVSKGLRAFIAEELGTL
jgi:hypothetical protein